MSVTKKLQADDRFESFTLSYSKQFKKWTIYVHYNAACSSGSGHTQIEAYHRVMSHYQFDSK